MSQQHFEFKDWQQAEAAWKDAQETYDDPVLIISSHHYTSGYWIEEDKELHGEDAKKSIKYRGEAATDLFNRIRQELEQAKSEGRGVRFIT